MGRAPGENISNPPQIPAGIQFYWMAYQDLSTERPPGGFYAIPHSKIREYCERLDTDLEIMKRIIWKIDTEYLTYLKNKADQHAESQKDQKSWNPLRRLRRG